MYVYDYNEVYNLYKHMMYGWKYEDEHIMTFYTLIPPNMNQSSIGFEPFEFRPFLKFWVLEQHFGLKSGDAPWGFPNKMLNRWQWARVLTKGICR